MGTRHGIFIGLLYVTLIKEWYQSSTQRETRKSENEQEGDHKTTQAGHSGNPVMVSGGLFTAFYQAIILGDNSSHKLPLGTFSIINKKICSLRERSASCVDIKQVCVIAALPSGYVHLECFPFELYLIGHRPYEIHISWAIEEIHPDLNKLHDLGVALVLKLAFV